jgi:hypothetical protein
VDQKRLDAIAMLGRMAEHAREGWRSKVVEYDFAHTDAWDALSRVVRFESQRAEHPRSGLDREMSDEVNRNGPSRATFDGAMCRCLALEVARQARLELDPRAVEAAAEDFRRERGLLRSEQFDEWIKAQGLSEVELGPYFRREATVRRVMDSFEQEMGAHIADYLRSTGEYDALIKPTVAKRGAQTAPEIRRHALKDPGARGRRSP